MTNSLRAAIANLANTFASSLLDSIRTMSLDEILAETGTGGHKAVARSAAASAPKAARAAKRLGRRTAGDIAAVVAKIVAVLEATPKGLRSERIRDKLGLVSKEMPRPLTDALDAGKIRRVGERRSTTYFAKGNAPVKPAAKAAVKSAAKPEERTKAKASRKAKKAGKAASASAPA
jgi:hypothetical protein